MIVVDTSVIVAVLFDEPERDAFLALLKGQESAISAGNLIECVRAVGRRKPRLRPRIHRLIVLTGTQVVPVDHGQVRLAEDGHARFGKGRAEPPAVLNFGDLFAYALARQLGAPRLYKGDGFGRTDIRPALPARPAPCRAARRQWPAAFTSVGLCRGQRRDRERS